MASFTGVGDNLIVQAYDPDVEITFSISGTYDMEVAVQVEQGSPYSDVWKEVARFNTANATESYSHVTGGAERVRAIVVTDTSGTATVTGKSVDAPGFLLKEQYNISGGTLTRLMSVPRGTITGQIGNVWSLWYANSTELAATMDTNGFITSSDPRLIDKLDVGDFVMANTAVESSIASGLFVVRTNDGSSIDLSNISSFGLANTD